MAIRVLSCAVAAALLVPATVAAQSPTPVPDVVLGTRIPLADGRGLSLACSGPELTPHPVVLFEADRGRLAGDWASVQAALPEDVRACAYDRPGTGSSDAVSGVRVPGDDAADLRAALDAIGAAPPYVVVAEGAGAWWAAAFIAADPGAVTGAVFVEPVAPTRDAELRAALGEPDPTEPSGVTQIREALDAFLTEPLSTPGRADLAALAEAAQTLDLGDRPLVLLEPEKPLGILDGYARPASMRQVAGLDDAWTAAWQRIRTWGPGRSATVTQRQVTVGADIARRRAEIVVDGVMDVIAASGIRQAPGRTIATIAVVPPGGGRSREPQRTRIEDRTGLLLRARPATSEEAARITRGDAPATVRFLDVDRTRLGIGWRSATCEPVTRIALDGSRMRVTVDRVASERSCAGARVTQAIVLELREPLPRLGSTIVSLRSLRTFVADAPSRVLIGIPTASGPNQVEVTDASRRLRSARSLTPAELRGSGWRGAPDGIGVRRAGDEMLVRWSTLPCVSWSSVALSGDGVVSVEDGAVPDCDAASAPRGVALRFEGRAPGVQPGELQGPPAGPEGALIRAQAEAAAMSVSLVDYRVLGARLAQGAELDARLVPAARWVWSVAMANTVGNDVCPDGMAWDGPPCPNLSSVTVYLDAVTGELLGTRPGVF